MSTQYSTGRINDVIINYEQSKKDFLNMVEEKMSDHHKYRSIYKFHLKTRIEHIIAQKLESQCAHAKFEVTMKGGKNILMTSTIPYTQVLSWDEMFDIFMPIHVSSGHRGGLALKQYVMSHCRRHRVQYKFPPMCLYYFRLVCNHCVATKCRFYKWKALKVGVVHVMAMAQTRSEERFRYLLIYGDKYTNYTILRPLIEKTGLEISLELCKIFMQFGPPTRLVVHSYNSSLTENIGTSLNKMCPEFEIVTEHQPSQYELPTVVTERLQDWMNKTKSLVWEVGCYVVQAEMNRDPRMRPSSTSDLPHDTPHALYFHTENEPMRDNTPFTGPRISISGADCSQATNQNQADRENQNTEQHQETSEKAKNVTQENANIIEETTHNQGTNRERRSRQMQAMYVNQGFGPKHEFDQNQSSIPIISLIESEEDIKEEPESDNDSTNSDIIF